MLKKVKHRIPYDCSEELSHLHMIIGSNNNKLEDIV